MMEKRHKHKYGMAQLNLQLPQHIGSMFNRECLSSASANTSFNVPYDLNDPNYDLSLDRLPPLPCLQ
jgi:hypothetical protein